MRPTGHRCGRLLGGFGQARAADESKAALQEALELFERKENVVEAKNRRELLSAARARLRAIRSGPSYFV
jgi:hypothetical protein